MGRTIACIWTWGELAVIAEAKLNGRDLGILWKPPFRTEVTEIVHAGANDLEISVVNLWPNRLIGDEQLPSDREWTSTGVGSGAGALSAMAAG